MGSLTRFGDSDELSRLFEAIWRGDHAAARAIDPDFVGFHCRECGLPYCDQCWRSEGPVFDEGFYDYTRAACPQGHRQIIDD